MESLDLYFLKFITYFLVVCMSCIFNKPFELTLWVLQQRTSKGPLSPSLSLFSSSLHCILQPFHLAFPTFSVWTPSSDDFSPQLWEKCEERSQRLTVGWFHSFYHHLPYQIWHVTLIRWRTVPSCSGTWPDWTVYCLSTVALFCIT